MQKKLTRREALGKLGEASAVAAVALAVGCRPVEPSGGAQKAPATAARPPQAADATQEPPTTEAPADRANEDLGQEANDASGNEPTPGTDDQPQLGAETVKMRDIRIMSGFEVGVLTTAMLKAGKEVTFDHWDGEGHQVVVTEEHMKALKRGETVKFRTTKALYHDHAVTIDPKNVVKNSAETEVPV